MSGEQVSLIKSQVTFTPLEKTNLIEDYIASNAVQSVILPISQLSADSLIMSPEISTQNVRSLLNVVALAFGGIGNAKDIILDRIDLTKYYLAASDESTVEQLNFNHLLDEYIWISNTLACQIFETAEKNLKGTIFGDDPLYEAGKSFGLSFSTFKMIAFKFMTLEKFIALVTDPSRKDTYSKITNIQSVSTHNKAIINYSYRENTSKHHTGHLSATAMCSWRKGVWHYLIDHLSLTDINIVETSCITKGDNHCSFEVNYKSEKFKEKITKGLISWLVPGLLENYEQTLAELNAANLEKDIIIEGKTAKLKKTNEKLKEANIKLQETNDIQQKTSKLLQKMVTTDELTQLKNRRYFDEKLNEYLDLSTRTTEKVTLIMFDIDKFKEINDLYGHPFGDKCLQIFASELKNAGRKNDFVARYGGEEFAMVLPATGLIGALKVAEKIRGAVEQLSIQLTDKKYVTLTVSAGIAGGINNKDALILAADKALYQAKRNGRNRVETAQ